MQIHLLNIFILWLRKMLKILSLLRKKILGMGESYLGQKRLLFSCLLIVLKSAVRSLSDPTQENIRNTIENIVNDKISDGQLKNSPISFRDIEIIKQSFEKTLKGIYHERIEYPKEDDINGKSKGKGLDTNGY